MHRIDSSTATPDNKFTEGNPVIPVAATTVTADWLNAVQEELIAVILAAGLTLAKSDNAQLSAAIAKLITAAKPGIATKQSTGLVQIGNGLDITSAGVLSVLKASTSQLGIVKLASALSSATDIVPTCKAVKDALDDAMPGVATKEATGLVQIGDGLSITAAGLLSVLKASTSQLGIVRLASALSSATDTVPTCKAVKDALDGLKIVIDPWEIFPMRAPLGVMGVTFGGSDNRRAIMPGESKARENWIICDGGSDGQGGTVPDLRGRFILGADDKHKAGSTGGSEKHSHSLSGTTEPATLTVEQLAAHEHDIRYEAVGAGVPDGVTGEWILGNGATGVAGQRAITTGSSRSHAHGLSGSTSATSNLPPFYSLTLIMRIS